MTPELPFTVVTPHAVTERLEALLPGLRARAAAHARERLQRRTEIWVRAHAEPLPDRDPADLDVLAPDVIWTHAQALGWSIASRPIGENFTLRDPSALAREVLGELAAVPGDILNVDHDRRAYRVPAARLLEFATRPLALTGDIAFDGLDELFVAADVPRIVLVHHEGWAIDLRAP